MTADESEGRGGRTSTGPASSYTTSSDATQAEAARDTDFLISALTEPGLREWAIRSLGNIGDPVAVPELLRLLNAHDPNVRNDAARALGKIRSDVALDGLGSIAANDPDILVRSQAISALSQVESPEIAATLVPLLGDPSLIIQNAAAHALAARGASEGREALIAMRRRQRFWPLLRNEWPLAPVGLPTALVLSFAWAAAALVAAEGVRGLLAWVIEGLVIILFRGAWKRAGEHAAAKRGWYTFVWKPKLDLETRCAIYLTAVLWTTAVWFATSHHALVLAAYFLALRVGRYAAERRSLQPNKRA